MSNIYQIIKEKADAAAKECSDIAYNMGNADGRYQAYKEMLELMDKEGYKAPGVHIGVDPAKYVEMPPTFRFDTTVIATSPESIAKKEAAKIIVDTFGSIDKIKVYDRSKPVGTSPMIRAIKEVRAKTSWGLKEAKDFVENFVQDVKTEAAIREKGVLPLLDERFKLTVSGPSVLGGVLVDHRALRSEIVHAWGGVDASKETLRKIEGVKKCKEMTGWDLKTAKDYVDIYIDEFFASKETLKEFAADWGVIKSAEDVKTDMTYIKERLIKSLGVPADFLDTPPGEEKIDFVGALDAIRTFHPEKSAFDELRPEYKDNLNKYLESVVGGSSFEHIVLERGTKVEDYSHEIYALQAHTGWATVDAMKYVQSWVNEVWVSKKRKTAGSTKLLLESGKAESF